MPNNAWWHFSIEDIIRTDNTPWDNRFNFLVLLVVNLVVLPLFLGFIQF